jgi:multicomponent Na+:H+ antiporter subunit D
MNALYLSADIFNIYVTLELLALSSIGLIALGGGAVALAAALRYLLAALLGSAAYLLGVALLYGAHGTLALRELAAVVPPGHYTALVLALMVTGLALKTALFPLHFWLPPAHGAALTPVSALLSGLVVMASFYLVLRLWFDLFGFAAGALAGQALGALGAAAIVWGALAALRQKKLKMLVAYSTVAQVGYFFLLFPMASAAAPEPALHAWTGGTLYAVSHAFAKAGMFLAAGAIVHAWGEDDIEHLAGTSARLPWSLAAFALAGVTLMGLPPSGGFTAKYLMLTASFAGHQFGWAIVMMVGGLLAAIYLFRPLTYAFSKEGENMKTNHLVTLSRARQALPLALAGLSIILGIASAGPYEFLQIGRSPAAKEGLG